MQSACRSPILDSYFAHTANLGTHTFYMIFLPICVWCGYPDFGIALIHMLGLGVYITGVLKDLVCLPRPRSPPLQRITMSRSAALEYGFPSTHATNALSVAMFAVYQLRQAQNEWSITSYRLICLAFCCYVASITLGRLYTGMHGYFDVIVGGILGVFVAWLWIAYGPAYDFWLLEDGWLRPAFTVLALALAVKFNPEPADNCPCFDDSVAFLGVLMGISSGTWHYWQTFQGDVNRTHAPSSMYPYTNEDLLTSAARLVVGIVMILAWRAVMKPTLLRCLPPIYRFVDDWGLMIPRRYFLQARYVMPTDADDHLLTIYRDYTLVPPMRKDDNVLPSISDIPSLLSSIRNPRKRRVSVGPQSEADAREFLASREQRRRDVRVANGLSKTLAMTTETDHSNETSPYADTATSRPSPEEPVGQAGKVRIITDSKGPSPASLRANAAETSLLTPASDGSASSDSGKEDEQNDHRMFSALEKPRTHYDAEVITKLVVYAGIGWLTVEGGPLLFEVLHLA